MSTQSDGWQKNRKTLLLIESSQNSHSNMEKPNYKTDTRCPLFFPIAWTAFWRNRTWNWVTYFSDFSTAEIHKCSSEVINLNIMISHPCRKQWLKKSMKAFLFFSDVGFASCTYVNYSYMKAKRWWCFSVAKVPEKANWCAARVASPKFRAGPCSGKIGDTAGVCGADRRMDEVVEQWLDKLSRWIAAVASRGQCQSPGLWCPLCWVHVQQCVAAGALTGQTLQPTHRLWRWKDCLQK